MSDPYRQIPTETFKQKISELELEIKNLKVTKSVSKALKNPSVYAKFAVVVTVVFLSFLIALYYIGVVRALTILLQIFFFVLTGATFVLFLPYFLYTLVCKVWPPDK